MLVEEKRRAEQKKFVGSDEMASTNQATVAAAVFSHLGEVRLTLVSPSSIVAMIGPQPRNEW